MPSVVVSPVMASWEEQTCSGGESADETTRGTREERREAKRQCRGSSSVKCQECGENEAKYRCPGCGLRSCGLPCVKLHKSRTRCDGKRKRTAFISVSEFDDNSLISDYNLLEEILRQADSAKRLRAPLCGSAKRVLPPSVTALQRAAKSRSTSLIFVATGMSRRKANTSFFDAGTRRIFWRVEWVFEGTAIRLVDERVDENLSLENVLAKHLHSDAGDVMVKHRLRGFCKHHLQELKMLLPKEPCRASEKSFYELNHKNRLREHLVNKTIIENPVITVVLPEDAGKFVIASVDKPARKTKDDNQADGPITPTLDEPEGYARRQKQIEEREPEGIPFREEEIEEEEIEEGEFVP